MQFAEILPDTYQRSPLHSDARIWGETNCYVDLWIEVLHAFGFDPRAGLGFVLSADFEGEQWQFIKYPIEDLWSVYGVDVAELNPWRGVEYHLLEHLGDGRLLTIEVDAFYLPDTAGVSYQREHVKSSIVVNMIDDQTRRLGYFHGASYYELHGEDFDGVLRRHHLGPDVLPPYVERVRIPAQPQTKSTAALANIAMHLRRRPAENPVAKLATRFDRDLAWLLEGGIEAFHLYAFATLRQCGATAELGASLCEWIVEHGYETGGAEENFTRVASTAKTMQFKLARLAAGRSVDHTELFADMVAQWDIAMSRLDAVHGPL